MTYVVAVEPLDQGSGRARIVAHRGGWLYLKCDAGVAGMEFLCKSSPAKGWTSAELVAVDALIWRGVTPCCPEPRQFVNSQRLVVTNLVCIANAPAALDVTLEAPRHLGVWRTSQQEGFWASQIVRALLDGHLIGVGWKLNAGDLLGQLRVVDVAGQLSEQGFAMVGDCTSIKVVREPGTIPLGLPLCGAEEKLHSLSSFILVSGKSVLLKGMPGCGKTVLVRAFCSKHALILFEIECEDVVGARLDDAFAEASMEGRSALVFLDNVERLSPAAVALVLKKLDSALCYVIGATSDADAVDSALRRPGRFDVEMALHAPCASEREAIVVSHMQGTSRPPPAGIGEWTIGMTAADLVALCWRAREADWATALMEMPRGGQARGVEEIPHKAWDDIGGLELVKQRIRQAIEWPIIHSERMALMGLSSARGVLLHGPPGCAKTSLVRALATNLKASFFVLTAASVYSPWVGAAEKTVRDVFERARNFPPSIIFIDEMEAVVGKRESGPSESSSKVQERVLSTLLNEMDGVGESKSVVVVRPRLFFFGSWGV
jgi:ATP-dependent 26S proteasome regulatory subunit